MNLAICHKDHKCLKEVVDMLEKSGSRPLFINDFGVECDSTSYSLTCDQAVSMIARREPMLAGVKMGCDVVVLDFSAINMPKNGDVDFAQKLIYRIMLMGKDVLVLHHDANVMHQYVGGKLDSAFEEIDLELINSNGIRIIPRNWIYERMIMDQMGGRNEINGVDGVDGIMQIVGMNKRAIDDFVNELQAKKDIFHLDISMENIMRFCRNSRIPEVERYAIAALLVDQPEPEGGDQNMMRHDWINLMNNLDSTKYPYIITSVVKSMRNIPNEVFERSSYVVQMMNNSMFAVIFKERSAVRL